jgi:cytochrome c biogenesis protein
MKTLRNLQKTIIDLKFAVILLLVLALLSSLGTVFEQGQSISYYQKNYSKFFALFFIFGINNIFHSFIFLLALFFLFLSLVGCSLIRQFPLLKYSKKYFFKNGAILFYRLPFFVKIQKNLYPDQIFLKQIKNFGYFFYQKKNLVYGYKGLIGRISPILVHLSLIFVLLGTCLGSIASSKTEEFFFKSEISNFKKLKIKDNLPKFGRINDFWLEYRNINIHQFYTNLSFINAQGKESLRATLSVNSPLKKNFTDFYQSDWNYLGLRGKDFKNHKNFEYPLFSVSKKDEKNFLSWLRIASKNYTIILDKVRNSIFIYNKDGQFFEEKMIYDLFLSNFLILEIIPFTGLLIKYDPSIFMIYLGFFGLIFTTFLSYIPYNQLWGVKKKKDFWLGSTSNRGKVNLEVEIQNFVRRIQKF